MFNRTANPGRKSKSKKAGIKTFAIYKTGGKLYNKASSLSNKTPGQAAKKIPTILDLKPGKKIEVEVRQVTRGNLQGKLHRYTVYRKKKKIPDGFGDHDTFAEKTDEQPEQIFMKK